MFSKYIVIAEVASSSGESGSVLSQGVGDCDHRQRTIMAREDNGKLTLFVRVSRRDKPGIIQAGTPASGLMQFGDISRGFAVVADEVRKLAEEAGGAAAKVSTAAGELVGAVDSVSAVIEQNNAASQEMAANSAELTIAIENIAAVSEQNSAAVKEVSASTEQVSAQVEQVSAWAASMMEMARSLQQIEAQFKRK